MIDCSRLDNRRRVFNKIITILLFVFLFLILVITSIVLRFLILEHGCNSNHPSSDGSPPLLAALQMQRDAERACLFLIEEVPNIDVNARTNDGYTMLMIAAKFVKNVDIHRALVAKGARMNEFDDRGGTALFHTVAASSEDAALYLLEEAGSS